MKYRALLVDLFGTIIPKPNMSRHREFMVAIAGILGTDPARVEKFWRASYVERIKGVGGSSRESVRYFLDLMDEPHDDDIISSIDKEWNQITMEIMVFFDDVDPVLRKLRDEGLRTGLVTNCGANVPVLFEKQRISELFDTAVYSSVEGLTKPDPEIFLTGCRNLGLQPGECAFVGDGDNDELIGSRKAGLFTIKIDRGESAGDYMIKPVEEWDPTIGSFNELISLL